MEILPEVLSKSHERLLENTRARTHEQVLDMPPSSETHSKAPDTTEDARAEIRAVLNARSYYERLGIPENTSDAAIIRKAYLLRSRVIHPDRNNGNPEATRAFQLLSTAYSTLVDPASRLQYDLNGPDDAASEHAPRNTNMNDDRAEETLSDALSQVFAEFLAGNFENIIRLADYLEDLVAQQNNSAPGVQGQGGSTTTNNNNEKLDREKIVSMLQSLRQTLLLSRHLWSLLTPDLLQLHSLLHSLNNCSYLDLISRTRYSIRILRVLLRIPVRLGKELEWNTKVVSMLSAWLENVDGDFSDNPSDDQINSSWSSWFYWSLGQRLLGRTTTTA